MSDAGFEEDVEQLSLSQLKSESVRLDKAVARLETRRAAVRERIGRLVLENRVAAHGTKRRARPGQKGQLRPKYRLLCAALGCDNHVARAGLCIRHGDHAGRRCEHSGCALYAQGGGRSCYQHGATAKQCSVEGCVNRVQRRGVCYKHGARDGVQKCSRPSCRNVVKADGVCRKHLSRAGAEVAVCTVASDVGTSGAEVSAGENPEEHVNMAYARAAMCQEETMALDAEASTKEKTRLEAMVYQGEKVPDADASAAEGAGVAAQVLMAREWEGARFASEKRQRTGENAVRSLSSDGHGAASCGEEFSRDLERRDACPCDVLRGPLAVNYDH